ncbi:intracellular serine protease [Aspergillus affinis]|uniref:intracellular serine protease n=1 Tax=Aspergillus affinis TaxID=1070780 RepID=UPI0022FF3CEC|nr:intracellular serine protease [Aspergillus affinis]KAI9042815.1 intracellular serine protease [Aspergillus affinis]
MRCEDTGKDLKAEASFEVFFGVRSVSATALQEAKITVKYRDLHNSTLRHSSEPIISNLPDFAHICQSVTESLDQRNCLHFALENGIFQRLRPQLKTFGSDPRSTDTGDSSGATKHMVHPNASVLALGILLCELHYCTPVELIAKDPHVVRKVNNDFYTCLDKLQTLEDDAGVDYYLATKACLTGEYYPLGQHADFEDVSVQRLFYQNVIKRLEANEFCWGSIGREVVRVHTGKIDSSNANNTARADLPRSMSDAAPPSSGSQAYRYLVEPSEKSLYFFDVSHQTGPAQENSLSEKWMNNLLSSIYPYVDPDFDLAEPVRIAILDSGLDPENPFLVEDQQRANPQIKDARSFVYRTEPHDIQDEIGHGTHALGLLLKVAPGVEIYVARIARRETLDPNTYDDIAKARLSLYYSILFGLT